MMLRMSSRLSRSPISSTMNHKKRNGNQTEDEDVVSYCS